MEQRLVDDLSDMLRGMIEERHRPSYALRGGMSVLLATVAGILALAGGHYVLGPILLAVAVLLGLVLARWWRSYY